MTELPEPIEYGDYRGRRNLDDKLDEVIAAVNQLIAYIGDNDEPN